MSDQLQFMTTWVGLARFFGPQWFKRLWIVQEYILGSQRIGQCGCGKWCDESSLIFVLDSRYRVRSLISTSSGTAGQAPANSRRGGIVCVILGSLIPMGLHT